MIAEAGNTLQTDVVFFGVLIFMAAGLDGRGVARSRSSAGSSAGAPQRSAQQRDDDAQRDRSMDEAGAAAPSRCVRFYLAHERAILGALMVVLFLVAWEGLERGWWAACCTPLLGASAERWQLKPIFISSPTLVAAGRLAHVLRDRRNLARPRLERR